MSVPINYDHRANLHSLVGPRMALPLILEGRAPGSVLDVGCGTGTWLRAALDLGVTEIQGIEGVEIPADQLHVPADCIGNKDLTTDWDLGRRFDLLLCFEVAEHLDESHALALISALTRHSDCIAFSAACPGQPGQHHVNCQWPAYWQQLFNRCGYVCEDAIRWRIWNVADIEPWYRQNMFLARLETEAAGREPRIPPVVHPGMMASFFHTHAVNQIQRIERGLMPIRWYGTVPFQALASKMRRRWKASEAGNLQPDAVTPTIWESHPRPPGDVADKN